MKSNYSRSTIYDQHRIPTGEILAMIIFLAGLVMSLVCSIAGAFLLLRATTAGVISQETGIVGITGCLCFLLVSLSWLYLKIHNLDD